MKRLPQAFMLCSSILLLNACVESDWSANDYYSSGNRVSNYESNVGYNRDYYRKPQKSGYHSDQSVSKSGGYSSNGTPEPSPNEGGYHSDSSRDNGYAANEQTTVTTSNSDDYASS